MVCSLFETTTLDKGKRESRQQRSSGHSRVLILNRQRAIRADGKLGCSLARACLPAGEARRNVELGAADKRRRRSRWSVPPADEAARHLAQERGRCEWLAEAMSGFLGPRKRARGLV